ncbi:MAG: RluA family pseudouridine synthase [Oscillospiraceae bacterium]|nr:RluA family pseudouridine synthase [Oscillospiraceae bacterium]
MRKIDRKDARLLMGGWYQTMILEHRVTAEEDGAALLHVLRRGMGLSAAAVRALKAHGGLHVDGAVQFTNYLVKAGALVTADVTRAERDGDNVPEIGPLEVLWEDEGLIAVNKPPGLIVHPSRAKNDGTLANFVAGYLQAGGQRPICHVVNRLDRDTSGVVLFAKNAHMKARATGALRTGKKRYTALVTGVLDPPDGVIDLPIRRFQAKDMRRIVAEDGKQAATRYRTVAVGALAGQVCSVLELTLETGRTHQIRVHCLEVGVPLIGDPLYRTEWSAALSADLGVGRQLLHSHYLAFRHPVSGEPVTIDAPIRDEVFWALLEKLEEKTL